MILNILTVLAVIWETVYSVSFVSALFRSKNVTGGLFVLFLAVLALALCLNFIFGFTLI